MKTLLLTALFLWTGASAAFAEVKTKTVTYEYGGVTMKGYLAWDDAVKGKRPGVLVVHEWWGLNDYAKGRAEQLAKMGYVALAADMYGEGKSTQHPQEAGAMAEEVRKDLKTWLGRANAALQTLRAQETVDPKKIAAIGYCFGGATVLQLAYSGADLAAVVSFHGALVVPESTKDIKARILILHGADDPFVTPDAVQKLRAALDQGKVNYRFVSYPGTVHGFTVPNSEKSGVKGVAYNAEADRQSWLEMVKLFQEVFK
jgi:dienelactone hydrolase